jgi:hypothetical protein
VAATVADSRVSHSLLASTRFNLRANMLDRSCLLAVGSIESAIVSRLAGFAGSGRCDPRCAASFHDGLCHNFLVRSSMAGRKVVLLVQRRCLVCDCLQEQTEMEETDVIGPACTRCHAPTERVQVLARRALADQANPHAAALGRMGGLKGGPARAAALSPKRRREIAQAAARARWRR